jgi:hypothetical protein
MKQSLFVFRIRVLMRPTTGVGTDAYGKSSHSRPPCSKISNITSTNDCYRVLPRHRIALMSSLTRVNKAVMLIKLMTTRVLSKAVLVLWREWPLLPPLSKGVGVALPQEGDRSPALASFPSPTFTGYLLGASTAILPIVKVSTPEAG